MFEVIGMIAAWLSGAACAFYVPLLIGMSCGGEGLAGVALGMIAAKTVLVTYVLATVAYFIIT